jgi:hypothetical protein
MSIKSLFSKAQAMCWRSGNKPLPPLLTKWNALHLFPIFGVKELLTLSRRSRAIDRRNSHYANGPLLIRQRYNSVSIVHCSAIIRSRNRS